MGDALTRDYGRRLARPVKWARNPLVVLILGAIASTLCGLCLDPRGFVLSIGLWALIAAGVAWPRLGVLGLRGTLSFEKPRATEGEPVGVRLSLHNRCPWGAWGLEVQAGLGSRADAYLSHSAGRGCIELRWSFVPGRRGAYPEGTPRIVSGFPFGLSSATRTLAVSDSLLVWPRTFAVGPIPQMAGSLSSEGLAPRDRPGGSGDFLGLRPYRRGDSLRRVHWPQTARLGQMVVRELQTESAPRVQVVLDVHPAWHLGSGIDGSREWAIRIAASLVRAWIGQGAEVELVVEGRAIRPGLGSVASRRACMMDALARLGPAGVMDLPEMLGGPACRRPAAGLRVVVATDLAVSRLDARPPGGASECFAVLRATAFGPAGASAGAVPLPIRPWAWIDDPAGVAEQVRRAWKGGILEG